MKKSWLASICVYVVALALAITPLFVVDDMTTAEIVMFILGGAAITTLLVLTIVLRKNKLIIIVPIILLFTYNYYYNMPLDLVLSDTDIMLDMPIPSYPTIEFILFIIYIVALVFSLYKNQKWATIVVVIYSAVQVFSNVALPILLFDTEGALAYALSGCAIVLAYAGQLVYFSGMLNSEKKKEEASQE